MILKQVSRVALQALIKNAREYSFKPIKRPDFSSPSSKAFVEKQMKDFNLQQILRAKIEMSGPLTGKMWFNQYFYGLVT
jgi:hypothetical protein